MRARQKFLGLANENAQPPEKRAAPFERVTFSESARDALLNHLYMPGRLRGGMLFGERIGDTMHIKLVSASGYPWWYSEFKQALLTPDERYLLGWSDCLLSLYGGTVDWVGNWMAYPNSMLGNLRDDIGWLDLGAKNGIFDDQNFLLTVGWTDGILSGRAYSCDLGERMIMQCDL